MNSRLAPILPSNPLQNLLRQGPFHIASVQRVCRFEPHDMRLFVSDRAMLHAARDDKELAFIYPHVPVPALDAKAVINYQKQFIFVVVMMPDEWPRHLH